LNHYVNHCEPASLVALDTSNFTVIVDYNTTSSITSLEVVVPTRLIRLFLLAASLSFTGAVIVGLSAPGGSPTPAVASALADRDDGVASLSITLLPIVRVFPDVEIPTLATVTVRPSRADMADVAATATTLASTDQVPLLVRRPRSALMSSGGFDMPYYSFGKTLRHVSKE